MHFFDPTLQTALEAWRRETGEARAEADNIWFEERVSAVRQQIFENTAAGASDADGLRHRHRDYFGNYVTGDKDIPHTFLPELEPADFDVPPKQIWHGRLRNLLKPLLLAFVVFSLISFATSPHDPSEIILALLILVPSLCLVPHMTMVTGQAFAGVVLSVFLVFCMKLLGCIVVVLVYGWSASDRDYTTTPWMAPNLLVCLFCLNCSVLCAVLYMLGRRRFEAKYSGSVACR